MIQCQNCGNTITTESNYCRFCGTKFLLRPPQPQRQPQPQAQQGSYGYAPPRPYAWQTDEFQTQTEPRQTPSAPMEQYQPSYVSAGPFTCPNCMSHFPPRTERRISTSGWIIFAVLLVLFFPLFWIGLLIKEEVKICTVCNARTSSH